MSKKDELTELDDLYRSFLLDQLRGKELDIKDASQIVQYLKANEITSERETTTNKDTIKKRIEDANERRAKV